MNILPKKRWHVRTKENIARVRRDEANAAAEEKEKQRRIQLAEQEARTELLRDQAKKRLEPESLSQSDKCTDLVPCENNKHVNFFNEVEDGVKSWGTNKEREEEKKQEQEKYEKSIGLLTYLGQTALDNKGGTPWYEKSHEKRFGTDSKDIKEEIGTKSKNFLDPLKDVQKYLDVIGKKKPNVDKPTISSSNKLSLQIQPMQLPKEGHHHKRKKHKKHSKKKSKKRKHHRSESETSSSDSEDNDKQLIREHLRAERLRREKEERIKAEKLLAKLKGENVNEPSVVPVPLPDGKQGYNSQFNPHLARKPRLEN